MKTKEDINYNRGPHRPPIHIPKGTPVVPADVVGPPCYWVCAWPGMSGEELAYDKKYGILIDSMETEE